MEKNNKLETQEIVSPSSINTFYRCPFKYWLQYIKRLKVKPSIHLVKGGIIHKTLEGFYKKYIYPLDETLLALFKQSWESYKQPLNDLELSQERLKIEREDCISILKEHLIDVKRKINNLIKIGKAENEQHGYYLIKPKFREIYVSSEELHCCGYIDRKNIDFDGVITLGDYKTGSKYGIGFPIENKRQLSIYALLDYENSKEMPDFVSVIFLRSGEELVLEVTPSLLKYARNTILDVYNKTRSIKQEDYPKKESNLCKYCEFKDICSKKEEFDKDLRISKLKQQLIPLSSKIQEK